MIKTKENYIMATFKAHQCYKFFKLCSLPIDILQIIGKFKKIKAMSYETFCSIHNVSLQDAIALLGSDLGACIRDKISDNYIILYNEQKGIRTSRFTIAHELAHIILKHFTINLCTYMVSENESNCFARNFLAPLFYLNDYTSEAFLSSLANISLSAAHSRLSLIDLDYYNLLEGVAQYPTFKQS